MNARTSFLIKDEALRVKNALGAVPGSAHRCVTAVAKRILLDGAYFYNGNHINPVGKSIGAGVWEITNAYA